MIGRLMRSEDFERVLGSRSRVSSRHFAAHHMAAVPARQRPADPLSARKPVLSPELSTGHADEPAKPVDDLLGRPLGAGPPLVVDDRIWLGTVVPKRHARRSVTRSLLKRQMRQATVACSGHLPAGIWVLRLRAPFDRSEFPSAASDALKRLAGAELAQLLDDAVLKMFGAAARPADDRRPSPRRR